MGRRAAHLLLLCQMPAAVSVQPRARLLRASAFRAPAMITASTIPPEPRPQPQRPPREFDMAEKLAEDEIDTELAVQVRPSESIFTGRWVDPEKPLRDEASFGTVVRVALATLDEYRREGRANSTRFSQEWTRYLAKLDRGDFRWEFLTPWRTEPLTVRDKAIVCVSLISGALIAQELWDPEASFWDHRERSARARCQALVTGAACVHRARSREDTAFLPASEGASPHLRSPALPLCRVVCRPFPCCCCCCQ